MSACPDVLGLELEDALARLHREGWQVTVKMTAPPRFVARGPRRVLRLVLTGERQVEIVAAHQGWGEGGARGVFPDYQ
jgi:hypothetical protein